MCQSKIRGSHHKAFCSWECREASKLRDYRKLYPKVEFSWTYLGGVKLSTQKNMLTLK